VEESRLNYSSAAEDLGISFLCLNDSQRGAGNCMGQCPDDVGRDIGIGVVDLGSERD
jgi:hypothetical protein